MKSLIVTLLLLVAGAGYAEQMRRLGSWEVHYVLIPTTFLNQEIAAGYGISRGADLALLNISVLSAAEQQPTVVAIEGAVTNLLGQRQPLEFTEVKEGEAIYYLASLRHTDREVLRFDVQITPPDGIEQTLRFQQQVYVEPQ